MKILKNTLIVSSYVLLVALFFGGGYAIGRIGMKLRLRTVYFKLINV